MGAIGVTSAPTPFTVEANGQTAAVVRATGVYLMEDGRAGTTQKVDLATAPAEPPEAISEPVPPQS